MLCLTASMAPPWCTAAEFVPVDGLLYTDDAVLAAATFVDSRLYTGGRAVEACSPFAVTVVQLFKVVKYHDAFLDVYVFELR